MTCLDCCNAGIRRVGRNRFRYCHCYYGKLKALELIPKRNHELTEQDYDTAVMNAKVG